MADEPAPVLTVYSRKDCHLCHDMIEALRAAQRRYAFELAVVDIDSDAGLARRYGADVPVLVHEERVLTRHRLAEADLAAFFSARC